MRRTRVFGRRGGGSLEKLGEVSLSRRNWADDEQECLVGGERVVGVTITKKILLEKLGE